MEIKRNSDPKIRLNYYCHICGMHLRTTNVARKHMRIKHGCDLMAFCPHCEFSCRFANDLS